MSEVSIYAQNSALGSIDRITANLTEANEVSAAYTTEANRYFDALRSVEDALHVPKSNFSADNFFGGYSETIGEAQLRIFSADNPEKITAEENFLVKRTEELATLTNATANYGSAAYIVLNGLVNGDMALSSQLLGENFNDVYKAFDDAVFTRLKAHADKIEKGTTSEETAVLTSELDDIAATLPRLSQSIQTYLSAVKRLDTAMDGQADKIQIGKESTDYLIAQFNALKTANAEQAQAINDTIMARANAVDEVTKSLPDYVFSARKIASELPADEVTASYSDVLKGATVKAYDEKITNHTNEMIHEAIIKGDPEKVKTEAQALPAKTTALLNLSEQGQQLLHQKHMRNENFLEAALDEAGVKTVPQETPVIDPVTGMQAQKLTLEKVYLGRNGSPLWVTLPVVKNVTDGTHFPIEVPEISKLGIEYNKQVGSIPVTVGTLDTYHDRKHLFQYVEAVARKEAFAPAMDIIDGKVPEGNLTGFVDQKLNELKLKTAKTQACISAGTGLAIQTFEFEELSPEAAQRVVDIKKRTTGTSIGTEESYGGSALNHMVGKNVIDCEKAK